MTSHTIKNLRDAEDHAPRFGFDAVHEARFPYRELEAQETGMAFYVVKPGCRQPFAHRHNAAEEIYVILSGRGRVKLDDEVVEVGPLDAIRVAPPVARAFEAAGDAPLEVLAVGARHEGDAEILRDDFWAGV
jgi:mannose-6-phosphate isomerase-like protein (cupin superfamily)